MSTAHQIRLFRLTGLVALASLFGFSWCAAQDESREGRDNEPQAAGLAPLAAVHYEALVECERCHRGPTPDDIKNGVTKRLQLNEYRTWHNKDKHATAYEVLDRDRAQKMAAVLGYDVKNDARCLNCHSLLCSPDDPDRETLLKDGVSCQACHGSAVQWVAVHWRPREEWWKKTNAEKEALGMTDVWDPTKRTKLCLSCHLGNSQKRKVVTHDMYAAGHPPLPGFEIKTFTTAMRAHWKRLSKKPPEIQKMRGFDPTEKWKTKLVVLGGLVSLRESLALLKDEAELTEQATAPRPGAPQARGDANHWPELALYDCSACHHDLRVPSWRQERGYFGQPGRPMIRSWPSALGRTVFTQVEGQFPGLDEVMKPVSQALSKRAFGRPDELAAATGAVIEVADVVIDETAAQKFDSQAALKLLRPISWLRAICTSGQQKPPDYDSARQLAWAFRVIYRDLDPKPATDGEIQAILKQLDAELNLHFSKGKKVSVSKALPAALETMSKYDSAKFQRHLADLADLLGPS